MKPRASLWLLWFAVPAWAAPASFDEAIERIVERSTAVAIQRSNLEGTRARDLPARLAFFPTLSLAGYSISAGNSPSELHNRRQLEALSQLNLFRFGADVAGVRAATRAEDRERSLVEQEILSIEERGVEVLARQIQRELEAEVVRKIADLQKRLLVIARQRYDHGFLPLQEVEKVSIDLDNAQARVIDAEVAAVEAQAETQNLLGDSSVMPQWPWKSWLPQIGQAAPSALAPLDLALRPEYKAAQSDLEAQESLATRSQRLILPSLDAQGNYDRYFTAGGTQPGWTAQLSLSFPLFDRLSGYSSYRAQAYAREAAEQRLEQARRDAVSQWQSARKSFETALQSAISRDRTLQTSRRLYEDNLRRFQGGKISANDLSVDQDRLFRSELFEIQGWSTVHQSFARLCHALGRRLRDCRGQPG